jgi:hypothetical protein
LKTSENLDLVGGKGIDVRNTLNFINSKRHMKYSKSENNDGLLDQVSREQGTPRAVTIFILSLVHRSLPFFLLG